MGGGGGGGGDMGAWMYVCMGVCVCAYLRAWMYVYLGVCVYE